MKIGFLGQGLMGSAMCARLIRAGHDVYVWNRTAERCADVVALGARQQETPAAVVTESEITIAMVSDPAAAHAVVFDASGVASAIGPNQSYVDMSTVDAQTAREIDRAIRAAGGRYLEAPVSGTRGPAIDGTLIILAAGDESLYQDARPLFEIMGKQDFFYGEVGQAARMKLIVNMVMGGMMTAFCEGLALAERSGLSQSDLREVLAIGALANPMFSIKGPLIEAGQFAPAFPLKHMQKDLRLATLLGDELEQPVPTAAAAHEAFIVARALGLADADFCAVFRAIAKGS